jgi:hypothetical protein
VIPLGFLDDEYEDQTIACTSCGRRIDFGLTCQCDDCGNRVCAICVDMSRGKFFCGVCQ